MAEGKNAKKRASRSSGSSDVAYIRVFKGADQQWYYEPRSANNKTLSTSEAYTRGSDATRAAQKAYPGVEIRPDQ